MITEEKKLLYATRIAFSTLVLLLLTVVLHYVATLDMTLLLYLGPFLTTLYVVEHMERNYQIQPKAWLKQKFFYVSAFVWQAAILFSVIYIHDIEFKGSALVFALQTLFSIASVYVSHSYASVRARKRDK